MSKIKELRSGCMVFNQHGPHSWREGFLWLTKKHCRGLETFEYADEREAYFWRMVNPAIGIRVKPELLEHKHFYRLKWGNEKSLMFECEKCYHQRPTDRESLYYALTHNHNKFKPWQ